MFPPGGFAIVTSWYVQPAARIVAATFASFDPPPPLFVRAITRMTAMTPTIPAAAKSSKARRFRLSSAPSSLRCVRRWGA
jgi:hypothetical protein